MLAQRGLRAVQKWHTDTAGSGVTRLRASLTPRRGRSGEFRFFFLDGWLFDRRRCGDDTGLGPGGGRFEVLELVLRQHLVDPHFDIRELLPFIGADEREGETGLARETPVRPMRCA